MWRWVHAPDLLVRENSYRSLELSIRRGGYRPLHPPVVRLCARCRFCLFTALVVVGVLLAVVRQGQPLETSPSKALVEAAESLDPAKSLKNMDPYSVRVRWKSFNSQCLGVWQDKALHSEVAYGWTVWQCKHIKEAWWRQRFILPKPGVPGQIKSLIGQVYDDQKREYCLTVTSCVTGTPVVFMPCGPPGKHNKFVLKQAKDGTVKIGTPECPVDHCVDVPDKNNTLGNYAQVWHCKGRDAADEALLKVDEIFNVGISRHDEEVFKAMVLSHEGPPSCKLVRVPFEKGLGVFHSRCSTASTGKSPLKFSTDFAAGLDDLSAYATIWSLWCEDGSCSCTDVTVGDAFASVPRQSRSTVCGALMLSTHPDAGECPPDLKALETKLAAAGKADCEVGHKAVRELAEDPSTHSRLSLTWIKAVIIGISQEDIKSFEAVRLQNSSGGCNASKPEGKPLEKISVRCPQDDDGERLGLEMTSNGTDLTKGSTVWALWCIKDECKCKAASKDRELVSAKLRRGDEGCAVMMMSVHSKFGACPPDLVQLQRIIEGGGDEIDCEAGEAASEQIAADPNNEERLRLKWVKMKRDQSALDKLTQNALNIFSAVGGVVVIGTVPAWPAVAKFTQFLVMMASNHAELGVPEEFNDFARKFSKFNDLVKPLKNLRMPGLSDLGVSLDFLASSKWFLLKERLMHQTMMVVVRVLNASGMISSGTACFLDNFYDPARRELGNLTAALEKHGGEDPCDYSEDESEGRRLAEEEEEEVEPDDLVASDGGPVAAKIRQHWDQLQTVYDKPIQFLEDKLDYTKKEFSVTKSLLFCLMVLPALIPLYLLVCAVLYCMKHRYSFIPHLRPSFLLIFMADLVLLNMLMAWANVVWRRRLLQCENPFQMLYQATLAWEGLSISEPITSAFMAVVNYFKPIISLFALWDGLHVGLEQSKLFANIIFVLGPCLIFVGWVLHAFCSSLGRHERTNRFLDAECKYLKASQPVAGSFFRRVLFFEPTEVAQVKSVVATKADGEPLYAAGGDGLQGEVWRTTLAQSLRGCCHEEAKEKAEGVDIQVTEEPELIKPMSDESVKLDWAYRLHGFEVGCRGLPEQITIAFEASGDRKPDKPELRLHLARGSQVLSVAFQARCADDNKPLPAPKKLGENPTEQEQQAAQKALLAVELLQSSWRKRLLARVSEVAKGSSNELEIGGLRWTMWDMERNEHNPWILASFNVLLPRVPGTEDAVYVRSATNLKQRLQDDVRANFSRWDIALHQGWDEAHRALNSFQANCQSAMGMVPDGPVWREIAERSAKATLTPDQFEWAFAEVDLSRVQVTEVEAENPTHYHKRVEDEEARAEKDRESKPTSPDGEDNPMMEDRPADTILDGEQVYVAANVRMNTGEDKPLAPAKDPKAPQAGQPKTSGHGYFMNVSAATSFEDDRLEQLELDFYLDKGKLFLVLSSKVFRHMKRGDLVEIWLAGKNPEEQPESRSPREPLTSPSWTDMLKKSGAKVLINEIKPWEDHSNPFSEVAVLREQQDRNTEWFKAVRRFPDAFVGKVQVPLQLQESTYCDLTLKVASRDLLHLNEEVPLTVPLEHLQLRSRDQWRVFYLSDHRMRRDELPQIIKIINGLNTFCMVMAVVLVPRNYNPEEMEKKNKEANEKWAEACRKARGDGEGKCNAEHKEFAEMTESAELAQHVVTGLSAAMFAIGLIIIIKVLLNCWNDGELKLKFTSFKKTWVTLKMEWAHFMKIFNREKTVILKVKNLNYTKVESDPNLASTLLQVVRGKTKGVEPDTIHADLVVPEDSKAVVYAKAKSAPKETPISTKHTAGDEVDVLLEYDKDVDSKQYPGCVPTGVEQGIGLMLAKHAGEKGQGWFRQLTQAVKSTVAKITGWTEAKDTTRICAFRVTAKDLTYKELTEVEIDLDPAMKEAFKDGAEAVEFTCASIWVRMTLPVSAQIVEDDMRKAIENEEELRAAWVGDLSVELEEETRQRCPSWLTFGFVLNVLKLLLVLFVAIVCLANGGNIFQAVFAMLLCLALWLLSRLTWDNAVEGSLFKSSTMEIGQVAIILVALLCQLNFLNRFSASCVMIIGVLWAIVLLCCRFLNDQIKMWQKDISKQVDNAVKTMKKSLDYYTKGIPKAIREAWGNFMMALRRFKVHLFKWWQIYWHGVSADTRDPAWRWGVFFGFLCFLAIIAIAVGQTVALRRLGEQVSVDENGMEENKHAQLVRQIPFMLCVFVLTSVAMIVVVWLFTVLLPRQLTDCREAKGARDRHLSMAEDAVKAVWCSDSSTSAEDAPEQRKLRNMLIERERAYEVAGRSGSPKDPSIDRVFFDPLGGLAPISSVRVFADDSGSIMQGSLLLQSGQVPFKRLLCTEGAWASPRHLVVDTPLQVSLKALGIGKVSTDSVPWVEPKQKVLVCALQIVNFVGLTVGKTEGNDGVLTLWRSPELENKGQLLRWFEEVRLFFRDYGASFERGSGVYGVLESLFWGIKDYGGESTQASGLHLQEHKDQRMLKKDGVPHQSWLNRNMEQIVRTLRVGPKDAQKNDWGVVSDDEEKPEVIAKLKERPRPAEDKPKSSWLGGGGRSPKQSKQQGKGTLHLTIVGAANLSGEAACCVLEAKTDPPVNVQTSESPGVKSKNPTFGDNFDVPNFYLGKTALLFQVFGDSKQDLGSKEITLSTQESSRTIILETGAAKPGCCAGSAQPQAKLNIQYKFQEDGEDSPPADGEGSASVVGAGKTSAASDNAFPTGSSSSPDPMRTKREAPCVGFCGGPLAWALMYPPTVPQLLHVVVTAEDLRPREEAPRLVLFGSAPRRNGGLPPLREQRALPRERMTEERPEAPEAE